MSTTAETTGTTPQTPGQMTAAYPAVGEGKVYFGIAVWPLGGDEQLLAGGHGRRAVAALSAYRRDVLGPEDRRRYTGRRHDPGDVVVDPPRPQQRWAVFHEGCGCTEDQHAGHRAQADRDGDDPYEVCRQHGCSFPLMPPCEDEDPRFAWWVDYASSQAVPGALAVTVIEL